MHKMPERFAVRHRVGVRAVAAGLVVALALALAGCGGSPTLLNESDFENVDEVTQDAAQAGWSWCNRVRKWSDLGGSTTKTTRVSLDGFTEVSASLYTAHSSSSAQDMLEAFRKDAAECADGAERDAAALVEDGVDREPKTIEPLTDLDEGMIGWQVRDPSVEPTPGDRGVWGEVILITLDEEHVLAVGFETDGLEPPLPRDELIRLGLDGVERVGLDD